MANELFTADYHGWLVGQIAQLRRVDRTDLEGLDVPGLIEALRRAAEQERHDFEQVITSALSMMIRAAFERTVRRDHLENDLAAALSYSTPSMPSAMDLDATWSRALIWSGSDAEVTCPLTFDELLADEPDTDGMIRKIADRIDQWRRLV